MKIQAAASEIFQT